MRPIILMGNMIALAALALPTAAGAEGPEVSGTSERPPGAPAALTPAAQHLKCEPIAGNPQLEHEAKETPPPDLPNGEPTPPPPGPPICPKGTLPVGEAQGGPTKHARPFGLADSAFGPTPPNGQSEEGFFYVGDVWEPGPIIAAEWKSQFSGAAVPQNARPAAHTIGQVTLVGLNKRHEPEYTLEEGWIKEWVDEHPEPGGLVYHGPRLFFFVNPDNYGPESGYDIGWVAAEGFPDPFGEHFYKQDGSPESYCEASGTPCRTNTAYQIKQYKGAWWFYLYLNGKKGWWGRVSDEAWHKHFTKAVEVQSYGEVYDWPNAPVTPMGDGYKGTEAAATQAFAPILDVHPPKVKSSWKQQTYHQPIPPELENWPQRYVSGLFNSARTEEHYGG